MTNHSNFYAAGLAALVMLPAGLSAQTIGYFEINDTNVIGVTNEKIGVIEVVLADAAGKPVAVVIETESFLGLDDEDVIVALDELEFVDGQYKIGMTEEELEALPKWND